MDYFWHDAIKKWLRSNDRPKRCVCIIQDEKEHDLVDGAAEMFGMHAIHLTQDHHVLQPASYLILTGLYDDVMSRAMNRGIGVSIRDRPLHFGLLNCDSAWVSQNGGGALEGMKSMHRLGTYRADSGTATNASVIPMKDLFDSAADIDIKKYLDGTAGKSYKISTEVSGPGRWTTLRDHSIAVYEQAKRFEIQSDIKKHICRAARLHDIGKAHHTFQDWILSGISPDERAKRQDITWAKRPRKGANLNGKINTRHDLIGGLSRARHSEIEAYLILSHHGRYRTAVPDVTDSIPGADVGIDVPSETFAMTPSHYTEIFCRLYKEYGPFKLAYMEAMLRCADIITSRKTAAE